MISVNHTRVRPSVPRTQYYQYQYHTGSKSSKHSYGGGVRQWVGPRHPRHPNTKAFVSEDDGSRVESIDETVDWERETSRSQSTSQSSSQSSSPVDAFSDTPFASSSRLLTDGIVAINTLVFFLQLAFANQLHLTELGVNVHAFVDEGEIWRLITSIFLHGSVLHLLLNNISLHALGAVTEWTAGKKRFLAFYLLSGVGGNLCSYAMTINTSGTSEEQIASLGASGAIFGLAGALLVFFWRNQVLYRDKDVPNGMFWRLLGTVFLNFAISEVLPDIDVAGHWGGLLSGVLLAVLLGPHYELVKRRGQENEVYLVDTSVMSDGAARLVYMEKREPTGWTRLEE